MIVTFSRIRYLHVKRFARVSAHLLNVRCFVWRVFNVDPTNTSHKIHTKINRRAEHKADFYRASVSLIPIHHCIQTLRLWKYLSSRQTLFWMNENTWSLQKLHVCLLPHLSVNDTLDCGSDNHFLLCSSKYKDPHKTWLFF